MGGLGQRCGERIANCDQDSRGEVLLPKSVYLPAHSLATVRRVWLLAGFITPEFVSHVKFVKTRPFPPSFCWFSSALHETDHAGIVKPAIIRLCGLEIGDPPGDTPWKDV